MEKFKSIFSFSIGKNLFAFEKEKDFTKENIINIVDMKKSHFNKGNFINEYEENNNNNNLRKRQRKFSKDFQEKNNNKNNDLEILSIKEIKEYNMENYKNSLYNSIVEVFPRKILYHQFGLICLNFSLGILFLSLINIFPHFHYHFTYSNITQEIYYSKKIHTILLFFFPLVFLIKCINRKSLLFFSFLGSLFINLLVLLNLINSTAFVHIFRFIWNVCYITTNLYNVEATPKKIRSLNSSIMNLFFRLSSIVEILMIEKLIAINLYLPVVINIVILFFDILLIHKFGYETHGKTLEQIEAEIN